MSLTEEQEKELKEERLRIEKISSIRLIVNFERLIREGAGEISTPLLWYRDEILKRCVLSEVEEEEG